MGIIVLNEQFQILLNQYTKADGWDQGLLKLYNHFEYDESIKLYPILYDKISNCKLLLKSNAENVLVLDGKLGISVDSVSNNFKKVFNINPSFELSSVIQRRNSDGNVVTLQCEEGYSKLPFKNNSFDAVFIPDLTLILKGDNYDYNFLNDFLGEIIRILSPDGELLFNYLNRGKNYKYFKAFFKNKEFTNIKHFFFGPTVIEQNELVCSDKTLKLINNEKGMFRKTKYFFARKLLYPFRAQKRGMIVSKKKNYTILDRIISEISDETGCRFNLNKIMYLNSNLLFLENRSNKEQNYVVRIPYSYDKFSESRCKHNFSALFNLKNRENVVDIKTPEPVMSGCVNSIPYYVESWLNGYCIDSKYSKNDILIKKSTAWSVSLYINSRFDLLSQMADYKKNLNTLFSIFNIPALNNYKSIIDDFTKRTTDLFFDVIESGCISHGDYKLGNVLFDDDNTLTGLIDWDLFMDKGLPLIDVIHTLAYRKLLNQGIGHDQFIHQLLSNQSNDDYEKEIINMYLDATGLSKKNVPILFIVYWLHSSAFRMVSTPVPLYIKNYVKKPLDIILEQGFDNYVNNMMKLL